jgi:hypothetical protein
MAAVICWSTEFKCAISTIIDNFRVTAAPIVSTNFSEGYVRDCSVSVNYLKYMKTLVDSSTSVGRHVLYASQLTPWSTWLVMESMIYTTQNTSMSPTCTAPLMSFCTYWISWKLLETSPGVSLSLLMEGFHKAESDASVNDYRLSKREAISSSHLVPQRSLQARSLMMLVFRTYIYIYIYR